MFETGMRDAELVAGVEELLPVPGRLVGVDCREPLTTLAACAVPLDTCMASAIPLFGY